MLLQLLVLKKLLLQILLHLLPVNHLLLHDLLRQYLLMQELRSEHYVSRGNRWPVESGVTVDMRRHYRMNWLRRETWLEISLHGKWLLYSVVSYAGSIGWCRSSRGICLCKMLRNNWFLNGRRSILKSDESFSELGAR